MSTDTRARHPQGTPAGGQFTSSVRPECATQLGPTPDPRIEATSAAAHRNLLEDLTLPSVPPELAHLVNPDAFDLNDMWDLAANVAWTVAGGEEPDDALVSAVRDAMIPEADADDTARYMGAGERYSSDSLPSLVDAGVRAGLSFLATKTAPRGAER